jgi:two-component system, OmpR family, sensor histidine kinase KdpD
LRQARAEARLHEQTTARLFRLSELLVADRPLPELLGRVASIIEQSFHPRWAAVLLPGQEVLEIAAHAGQEPSAADMVALVPPRGHVQTMRAAAGPEQITRVALSASSGPVGVIALADVSLDPHDWALLQTFADQAASAIERSQLRERALHAGLLEESDAWRRALLRAVSHDLRTPLASIKTSVSALRQSQPELTANDQGLLLEVIEHQSDRLARLVTNLLDMTRIESGALVLRTELATVDDLVGEALDALGNAQLGAGLVSVSVAPGVQAIDVDVALITEVLANLFDNASHHAPDGPIEVNASSDGTSVRISVADHGPGVAPEDRQRVFRMFNRVAGSGRAGLGLTIAKAFVEAHHGTITVDDAPGGGARFTITLPITQTPVAVD